MPSFPCPSRIDCEGNDSPFKNLSAEAPDQEVFFGFYTGAPWLQPPIGSNWSRNSCLGQCESTESQADADLCAAINNAYCMFGDWGPPGVDPNGGPDSGPPVIGPPSNPTPVFLNNIVGCQIACPDGSPFTYQVRAGLFPGLNQATADAAATSYACRLAALNAVCLSTLSTKACLGTAYNESITPSRPASYTFVLVSGALPPGLALAPGPSRAGAITGTPTTIGSYTFVVRVTNAVGNFMQKTYTINVMGFTNTTLADATQNAAYSETLLASGGTAPYTFTVEIGALPTGISLASDGTLSGTPTVNGDFDVTFGVTDSGINFCTKAFTLHVDNVSCPTQLSQSNTGDISYQFAGYAGATGSVLHPNKVYIGQVGGGGSFAVFDADTQVQYNTIAFTGAWLPDFTAYAPGTSKLFVNVFDIDIGSWYLRIINTATDALGTTIVDGAQGSLTGYYKLRYSSSLDRVLMLGDNSGATNAFTDALILNPHTNAFARFICTVVPGAGNEQAKDIDYCPDNNGIYVGCVVVPAATGTIRRYDATTHALMSSVSLGSDTPQGLAWNPDTSRIYIYTRNTTTDECKVITYDPATESIETSLSLGPLGSLSSSCEYWPTKTLMVFPAGLKLNFYNPSDNAILCTIASAVSFKKMGVGTNLYTSSGALFTAYH